MLDLRIGAPHITLPPVTYVLAARIQRTNYPFARPVQIAWLVEISVCLHACTLTTCILGGGCVRLLDEWMDSGDVGMSKDDEDDQGTEGLVLVRTTE